jgi:hypothetical protein
MAGRTDRHDLADHNKDEQRRGASRGRVVARFAVPLESVARQYRMHLAARLRTAPGGAITLPDRLDKDDCPLVREFRAFFGPGPTRPVRPGQWGDLCPQGCHGEDVNVSGAEVDGLADRGVGRQGPVDEVTPVDGYRWEEA